MTSTPDVQTESGTYRSVRDIPAEGLELAGRVETFRCPKMAVWSRTQIMLYANSSGDMSKLTKKQLGAMQDRLDDFFTAAMGRDGYEAFNDRFLDAEDDLDHHHLLYALVYLTEKWAPAMKELSAQARADVAALWESRPDTSVSGAAVAELSK